MNTTTRHLLWCLPALLLAAILFDSVTAPAAPPSRPEHTDVPYYQFNNNKHPIYDVNISADLPATIDSLTGQIEYEIKSVDPSNGQITFGYTTRLNTQQQEKHPDNRPFAHIPRPSFPDPWAAQPAAPDIVIDPFGKVVRSNRMTEAAQLPNLLGLAWQLMLQPLSETNQPTWQVQREMVIYDVKPKQQSWPPHGGPFQQRQTDEDRIERPCTETESYKIGEQHGNLLTIQRTFDLVSAEKTADGPVLEEHGEGQFAFDTQAGLIQSLDMKFVYKANRDNITIKVPISVSVKLLSAEEAAKIAADREKQIAEIKARFAARKSQTSSGAPDAHVTTSTLPVGASKTVRAGMPGDSEEFVIADPDNRRIVGFRTELSDWGRLRVFRRFEPLYDRTAKADGSASVILAKEGYVVGGLIVSAVAQQQFNAVRVIFIREKKNGKIDAGDKYDSEWIGKVQGGPITRLAGNGESVIGICGRRGLNVDGIALVVTSAAPPAVK